MFAQPTIEDDASQIVYTEKEIHSTPTTVTMEEAEQLETPNDDNMKNMEQEMQSLANKVSVVNFKVIIVVRMTVSIEKYIILCDITYEV